MVNVIRDGNTQIICTPLGYPAMGALEHLHLCTTDGSSNFNQISGLQTTIETTLAESYYTEDFRHSKGEALEILVGMATLLLISPAFLVFARWLYNVINSR